MSGMPVNTVTIPSTATLIIAADVSFRPGALAPAALLTVHTPQDPVVHPSLVPFSPIYSRMTSNSVWRLETGTS